MQFGSENPKHMYQKQGSLNTNLQIQVAGPSIAEGGKYGPGTGNQLHAGQFIPIVNSKLPISAISTPLGSQSNLNVIDSDSVDDFDRNIVDRDLPLALTPQIKYSYDGLLNNTDFEKPVINF